jgi:hypothetical protein
MNSITIGFLFLAAVIYLLAKYSGKDDDKQEKTAHS